MTLLPLVADPSTVTTGPGIGDIGGQLLVLRRLRSPARRAAAATALLEQLAEIEREVSAVRDEAVRRLREEGESYGSIAAASGLTRSRVVQLLQRVGNASADPAAP